MACKNLFFYQGFFSRLTDRKPYNIFNKLHLWVWNQKRRLQPDVTRHVSSYPLPGSNYHTHTQIRRCYGFYTLTVEQKMPEAFVSCIEFDLISSDSCWEVSQYSVITLAVFDAKWPHYISRTELWCLANWKGKVITLWIYTASSFVVLEMDLIKQNNTRSRDVLILMGGGNK